jgi:hypothetical protein
MTLFMGEATGSCFQNAFNLRRKLGCMIVASLTRHRRIKAASLFHTHRHPQSSSSSSDLFRSKIASRNSSHLSSSQRDTGQKLMPAAKMTTGKTKAAMRMGTHKNPDKLKIRAINEGSRKFEIASNKDQIKSVFWPLNHLQLELFTTQRTRVISPPAPTLV